MQLAGSLQRATQRAALALRRTARPPASFGGGSLPCLSMPRPSLFCTVPSTQQPTTEQLAEAGDSSKDAPEVIWRLRHIVDDMPPVVRQAFGRDNMCVLHRVLRHTCA